MREKFSTPFTIPVDDIKLDVQNFRYYGELESQRDCIDAMLKDPNSGIYSLAKDIVQFGLTPDPIVLSKDENGAWIVREGNRRIVALKLLNNPTIVDDKNARSKIEKIVKEARGAILDTVECISCDDESCILDYLERIHTGFRDGTGRRHWSPENKTRFDMHIGKAGANSLALQVKQMVQDDGAVLKEPYHITNLQRILQNKGVQAKLRFSFDGENIFCETDKDTLMKVLREIAVRSGDYKVKEIYTAKQQNDFVEAVLQDLNVNISKARTDAYVIEPKTGKTKTPTFTKGRLRAIASWDRIRLIPPRNTHLKIPQNPQNVKAANIANELARMVNVKQAPNAAAVLLRVFIELSANRYVSKNALSARDSLSGNIRSIAEHMERSGKITSEYKQEVLRICNDQSVFSVKSIQRWVHSFDFNPDRQVLCTIWDNIDRFISLCWE